MNKELAILKGIHPGFILERKIKEQKIRKGQLALDCHEYPQTLTAITKGKRHMNTSLALKLEKALGLEEGYLMTLQVFFEIKEEKRKNSQLKPDLSKLRRVLFWDTRMDSIDWEQQYKFIIRRIFERGNEDEKSLITKFYGQIKINEVLAEGSSKLKK